MNPLVQLFGDVAVGQGTFVAGNTVLLAAEGQRVEIGSRSNVQDNVTVRADNRPTTLGEETSLAHHAIVRDSEIGNFAFVGFNSEVAGSTIGNGTVVLHGALVDGVELPENVVVPSGAEITEQSQVEGLDKVDTATEAFKRGVLDVNAEFARGYGELYEQEGFAGLIGIGPNPDTPFAPTAEPQLGENVVVEDFARVVGDVRLGSGSTIGVRSAVRADEGHPIVVGDRAEVDDRVTFHALEETEIEVGTNFVSADDAVIHGPLQVGNDVSVGEEAVVFRAIVEDGVEVGDEAVIAGPAIEEGQELSFTIPAGSVVPDGAVISDEASLQEVLNQQ